ncbi:PEP-CTERM sorting domain-containing protein [Glaciecola sp. SC05]|uniref:PEP-CTERM sorting domain-containing protein n=1 Tax=Glaciecola sp. SC05 TaxID=1987355 RepID=UPI003529911A
MNLVQKMKTLTAVAALSLSFVGAVNAAPINSTGDLQNGVIFGSGNANGSFTGINIDGLELGLRGKLRYNLSGLPENTFNYDGDRTYTFDPANSFAPANRSIWNFEFSIDASNTAAGTLLGSGYEFFLGVDTDPTAGISNAFGPMGFSPLLFPDNASDNIDVTLASVIQNSQNLGFGFTMADPQLAGIYTISLVAINQQQQILSTSIDIVVGAAEVSAPATLSLLALVMLGFGIRRMRNS